MAIAIPKIRVLARGSVPARLAAAVAALTLAAGCSAPTHSGTVPAFAPPPVPTAEPRQATMDQSVNLVVWEGYAEPQWTAKFQQQTGCHVNATVADSSDEMLALVKTGKYDVVSASGDASLRMIASGDVAPVDLARVPNSRDIYPDMMNKPWDSVQVPGSTTTKQYVPYGVPHGRGANELVYNTRVVSPAPTSWDVVYDPNSKYKGHVTYYDSPISIADAALYLKSAQPALKIDNPYELTRGQLEAVVNLLEAQRPILSKYWTDASVEQRDFTVGTSVVGPAWQLVVNNLQANHGDFAVAKTVEGQTGWSDTWMITSSATHVNCAYAWINYAVSPQVNAQIAEYFGEAPANAKACEYTKVVDFCNQYHAADTDFWNSIYMWTTPTAQCSDDTTSTKVCMTYADWVDAWNRIKQSS